MKQLKSRKFVFLVSYSIIFCIITALVFSPYFIFGKSFVSRFDALSQHYVSIYQLKVMLKNVIENPTEIGHFWDWTLGLGADSFQSFSYYSVGDIFVYPFLFFKDTEMTYIAMMISKLFFSGLALFVFLKNKYTYKNITLLTVTSVYVFTGYTVHSAVSHPMFLTPLVIYPLLLLSIDRFIEGKGKIFFTIMVTWTLVSNFYFAFLLGIAAIFYFLIQVFTQKNQSFKKKLIKLLSIIPFGILGVALASVVLLPTLSYFFNSTRSAVPFSNGVKVYPLSYYAGFGARFISSPTLNSFEYYGGYAVIIIPALIFSLCRFKRYLKLNLSIIIGFICWLTPYLASGINGMATPSVRWAFLMTIPFAILIGNFLTEMKTIKKYEIINIIFVSSVFSVYVILGTKLISYKFIQIIIPLLIMWLTIIFMLLSNSFFNFKKNYFSGLILFITCLNVVFLGYYYNAPSGNNSLNWHLNKGKVGSHYKNYFSNLDEQVSFDKQDFYRSTFTNGMYDGHTARANIGPMIQKPMVNSYLSLQNGNVGNFSNELENTEFQLAEPVKYLDKRSKMSDYLGVKYLYAQNGAVIPNGFKRIKNSKDERKELWETRNNYPLVFTMSKQISEKDVINMNGLEKEELLSQVSVVKTAQNPVPLNEFEIRTQEISLEIKKENNSYKLSPRDTEELSPESDYFLNISGIDINALSFDKRIDQLKSTAQNNRISSFNQQYNLLNYEQSGTTIDVSIGNRVLNTYYRHSPLNISSYNTIDHAMLYLGQLSEKELADLTLKISGNSLVDIKSIKLYERKRDNDYDKKIVKIKENELKNLKIDRYRVTGDITLAENQVMTSSIPFSSGWKLKVNGKPQNIIRVNYGFVGAQLKKGKNIIELEYTTPLFKLGMLVSLCSLVIIIIYQIKMFYTSIRKN